MQQKIVKEGNAFYEIDDACMKRKEQERKERISASREDRKEKKKP